MIKSNNFDFLRFLFAILGVIANFYSRHANITIIGDKEINLKCNS